jgi:hypothetical protein
MAGKSAVTPTGLYSTAFLSPELAENHWQKAFQIAAI